jgi:alpha-1,2-glucosyltransferase
VGAVLIPSPLLEFRYYVIRKDRVNILAYYLYRIQLGTTKGSSLRNELILFMGINVFTFYMFLYRPFEWDSEPGRLQRFMW